MSTITTGYAVLAFDGDDECFVGIWKDKEIADEIARKAPFEKRRVVEMSAAAPGMLADAIEIADTAAWSAIECNTSPAYNDWYDTSSADGQDKDWIAQSVRYLDARQLLVHHPEHPELVRFKDEA